MPESTEKLRILRLILAVRETSAAYNQFSLPLTDKHEITICTYFGSTIPAARTITLYEGDGSLRGFFRALKAALEAEEYDVIHAHSPHVAFLFLLATLFSFRFRKLATSTVVTVHDSYQDYKLRNRLLFVPVFMLFRRVVCCGKASYQSFPGLFKWLAGNRLTFARNGLDLIRVDSVATRSARHSLPDSDFTVVAIGRLVDIKNPFTALTAFEQSKNPSSRMVFIGDGSLRTALIQHSREAAFDEQVTFTGLIPREKVFEQLLNADLFISTSRGEGLPVAVLEAMACRCPVLLSDIPPHREIAEGAEFIPLVEPDDVAGFAWEIAKFREMSASEREVVGWQCRKLVEERFSLQTMHARYEEIYAQITDGPLPSGLALS